MLQDTLTKDELGKCWTLSFDDLRYIAAKQERNQFDFAMALQFFNNFGKFPSQNATFPDNLTDYITQQISLEPSLCVMAEKRATQRRNNDIIKHLGLKPFDETCAKHVNEWLASLPPSYISSSQEFAKNIRLRCIGEGYEPPIHKEVLRLIQSSQSKYDDAEFERIRDHLPPAVRLELLGSIRAQGLRPSLSEMKQDPGRVSHKNFEQYIRLARFMTDQNLPDAYIDGLKEEWTKDIFKRVERLNPWEIRRLSKTRQLGLYTVYLVKRQPVIIDSLIDMIIDVVHTQHTRAKNAVNNEIGLNARRVYNQQKILKDILEAAVNNPAGHADTLIWPFISQAEAASLLRKGPARGDYAADVFEGFKNKWQRSYRKFLKLLLSTIELESSNPQCKPLIEALDWIHVNFNKRQTVTIHDGMPIQDVIADKWRSAVIGPDGVIDKYSYELCAILTLRECLRSRAIWTRVSIKYGNPDDDVPQDFEENQESYFKILDLEISPIAFVEEIKFELESQLLGLNAEIVNNPYVSVDWGPNKRFKISKLEPLKEPTGLRDLKKQMVKRWNMTSLMDMQKETALDTQFLKVFKSVGQYQKIGSGALKQRLLMCLFALGSNTGLKRISAATNQVSYDQLLHVKGRFIDADSIREANQIVVNAILDARDPDLWGEMGTTCASDSKQFQAWDQNPLSEYHVRYRGRGIMVYWHVEHGSVCIYSHPKRVSSPETGSMIAGVLKHASKMNIETQYVDSHGQTEVGFAFSRLLGFDLAPRIKNIADCKLYLPCAGMRAKLGELSPVLTRPINWKLVYEQYSEMVKYAVAMKLGTAQPENILRRFSRTDLLHPTYGALAELGRALKTIFICRYLRSEPFRREIQKGLNVMENWNSATNFIYFGKSGEFSSNRREDQELSVQALHLLQNCMVYVNTQMYQSILSDPQKRARMSPEDLRAITPLIYAHVNPYGRFDLDLEKRLDYSQLKA